MGDGISEVRLAIIFEALSDGYVEVHYIILCSIVYVWNFP